MRPWGTHQKSVMERLAKANGRIVSKEDLLAAMYGNSREPDNAGGVLKVTIYQLRLKHPGAITTHYGEGYSLDVEAGKAWLDRRKG